MWKFWIEVLLFITIPIPNYTDANSKINLRLTLFYRKETFLVVTDLCHKMAQMQTECFCLIWHIEYYPPTGVNVQHDVSNIWMFFCCNTSWFSWGTSSRHAIVTSATGSEGQRVILWTSPFPVAGRCSVPFLLPHSPASHQFISQRLTHQPISTRRCLRHRSPPFISCLPVSVPDPFFWNLDSASVCCIRLLFVCLDLQSLNSKQRPRMVHVYGVMILFFFSFLYYYW